MKKKLTKLALAKQTLSNLSAQTITGGISGGICNNTGDICAWTKGKDTSCGYTMQYGCSDPSEGCW